MVITGRTGNAVYPTRVPRVRIPLSPPRWNGQRSIQNPQPHGWGFLIPLRHSFFSAKSHAAPSLFACKRAHDACYQLLRDAPAARGILFIPGGQTEGALWGAFCFGGIGIKGFEPQRARPVGEAASVGRPKAPLSSTYESSDQIDFGAGICYDRFMI